MPVMATPVARVDDLATTRTPPRWRWPPPAGSPRSASSRTTTRTDLPRLHPLPRRGRPRRGPRSPSGCAGGCCSAALGLAAATALTPHPWLALALVVGRWSGCCAAARSRPARPAPGVPSAARRWYDGPQLLLASPWHVVQAIPGALLLLLWSLGLAPGVRAWSATPSRPSVQATLFACGVVLAVLRCGGGPGGSRLRGPVNRVGHARSRGSLVRWLVAWLLVLAAARRAGRARQPSRAPTGPRSGRRCSTAAREPAAERVATASRERRPDSAASRAHTRRRAATASSFA